MFVFVCVCVCVRVCLLASCEIEREKFYPGPGIKPGPLALRASALPLRYLGQLPIQGRINPFMPILSDLRTTTTS